jgi:SAM-dependent methyltransferase
METRVPGDDSTSRFTNRVDDYVRYRPGYPTALLDCLANEFELRPEHVVADVGSGTGIFTALLLNRGHTVFAIEPNEAMRRAAEERFRGVARFHSIAGSSEATTLPDASVDWLIAAQAFHWFDVARSRVEALRILRRLFRAALIWNNRREDTPFLAEYETFLHRFALDYAKVKHQQAEADGRITRFFGNGEVSHRVFANAQECDWDSLRGRTLSASYMPNTNHPSYSSMIDALRELFDRHARDGKVIIEYETSLHVGKL